MAHLHGWRDSFFMKFSTASSFKEKIRNAPLILPGEPSEFLPPEESDELFSRLSQGLREDTSTSL